MPRFCINEDGLPLRDRDEHSHHERPICQNASSRKLEVEAVSRARSLLSRVRRPEQPERRRDHHRRELSAEPGPSYPAYGVPSNRKGGGTTTVGRSGHRRYRAPARRAGEGRKRIDRARGRMGGPSWRIDITTLYRTRRCPAPRDRGGS